MCQYLTNYQVSWDDLRHLSRTYKCPHKAIFPPDESGKEYCIFHSEQEDKDVKLFYDEFKKLYVSGDHRFVGFVFPKGFDLLQLGSDLRKPIVFNNASFARSVFYCDANFLNCTFTGEDQTTFYSAKFKGEGTTSFFYTWFQGKRETVFVRAEFLSKGGTDFNFTEFKGSGRTIFDIARFSSCGVISFLRTQFLSKGGTSFNGTIFSSEKYISFNNARFLGDGKVIFREETFVNDTDVDFINVFFEYPERVTFDGVNLNRVRFLETSLKDIEFGEIWWKNRKYGKSRPKKRNMIFDEEFQAGTVYQILMWLKGIIRSGVELKESILLKKLRIIKSGTGDNHYSVHRLYNDLRLNYERTGRYHEAGDFFIGAMEMRRCGNFEKPLIRVLLHFYRIFSFYGERPALAFVWLFGLWVGFAFIYSWVGILYPAQGVGYIKDLLNGLMISLDVLALGKMRPFYDVINRPIIPAIKAVETIFGALFLSLFLLAMNRKFRRTKD